MLRRGPDVLATDEKTDFELFMNAQVETFESGYVGITIALKEQEIDTLIERLNDLKTGKADHFHFRNDCLSANEGLADLEFSIASPEEIDNLVIK